MRGDWVELKAIEFLFARRLLRDWNLRVVELAKGLVHALVLKFLDHDNRRFHFSPLSHHAQVEFTLESNC